MRASACFSLLHPIFRFLTNLLKRAFPSLEKVSPKNRDPRKADWARADAMVGTVRNREQLVYNLTHKCYYVPGRFLPEERLPIKYIALHERDEEDIPCIVRLGEVLTTETVERGTIPVSMRPETDPREPYCYFTVKDWNYLPQRIEIRDTARGKPLFTTGFLLNNCCYSWELFAVSSPEDYLLLEAIRQFISKPHTPPFSCRIKKGRKLLLKDGFLLLTDGKGTLLGKVSCKNYLQYPRATFLSLKKLLS